MLISRAVKIELDPTPKQAQAFARACGVARYVFNYVLALRDQGFKEAQLKGEIYIRPYEYKEVSKHRDSEAPWIGDVAADVVNFAIRDVYRAFSHFFSSCSGEHAGRRVSHPRFKKRGKSRDSFRVQVKKNPQKGMKDPITSKSIGIPRIGRVRVKEDPTTRIPEGARALFVCVSRDVDRWYASIGLQDVTLPDPIPRSPKTVGVDFNVARIVCSDGTQYQVPDRLRQLEKRERRAQQIRTRRDRGSNRHARAVSRLAKIHRQSRRVRLDWQHKVTTDLVRKNTRIVIEDLNVQGMTSSACGVVSKPGKNIRQKASLNRAILRAGFGELRRQLNYKGAWYGTEITVADRWFASSRICSRCGTKNESLTLADRIFRCGACGLEIDRDLNAAINLERVPSVETPTEVPAGSGKLTDVDRNKPGKSTRTKSQLIMGTGEKRQRVTHSRGMPRKPRTSKVLHAGTRINLLQRNRAGPAASQEDE